MPFWLIDVLRLIAGGAAVVFVVYLIWSIGSGHGQNKAHREGVRGYHEGYNDGYRAGIRSFGDSEPPGDS